MSGTCFKITPVLQSEGSDSTNHKLRIFIIFFPKLDIVVHICDPSTPEAEAGDA
jgi:hypothetical protein